MEIAGANADNVFCSAFAVDSLGGVAQFWSLGGYEPFTVYETDYTKIHSACVDVFRRHDCHLPSAGHFSNL